MVIYEKDKTKRLYIYRQSETSTGKYFYKYLYAPEDWYTYPSSRQRYANCKLEFNKEYDIYMVNEADEYHKITLTGAEWNRGEAYIYAFTGIPNTDFVKDERDHAAWMYKEDGKWRFCYNSKTPIELELNSPKTFDYLVGWDQNQDISFYKSTTTLGNVHNNRIVGDGQLDELYINFWNGSNLEGYYSGLFSAKNLGGKTFAFFESSSGWSNRPDILNTIEVVKFDQNLKPVDELQGNTQNLIRWHEVFPHNELLTYYLKYQPNAIGPIKYLTASAEFGGEITIANNPNTFLSFNNIADWQPAPNANETLFNVPNQYIYVDVDGYLRINDTWSLDQKYNLLVLAHDNSLKLYRSSEGSYSIFDTPPNTFPGSDERILQVDPSDQVYLLSRGLDQVLKFTNLNLGNLYSLENPQTYSNFPELAPIGNKIVLTKIEGSQDALLIYNLIPKLSQVSQLDLWDKDQRLAHGLSIVANGTNSAGEPRLIYYYKNVEYQGPANDYQIQVSNTSNQNDYVRYRFEVDSWQNDLLIKAAFGTAKVDIESLAAGSPHLIDLQDQNIEEEYFTESTSGPGAIAICYLNKNQKPCLRNLAGNVEELWVTDLSDQLISYRNFHTKVNYTTGQGTSTCQHMPKKRRNISRNQRRKSLF